MRAWNFGRNAGLAAGAIAVAFVGWALSANAQNSGLQPEPPPIENPNVEQAQFAQPATLPPVSQTAPRVVADPPSPVVRIQVRVPADSAPGDDLKYLITIQNISQADAHQVIVR